MESLSRLSSVLESTRDLTVETANLAGSSRGINNRTRDVPFAQVKRLLESRHDKEVIDGLRRVVSMMYRGKPCLPYFSAVVKNVASPNIEVKKLVYIYLVQYAESEPDLALLSINTIQKSLSDQNAQVRAMALRVMSGMSVPVISQIVSLAIKKGCADLSPHVRKAAALAIPKCYTLDPNTLPQLLEYLTALLGDKQYFVSGCAVMAFLEICPDRIDLIHPHYRSLVRKLVDMDDWSQLATLRLMTIYARRCFPRRFAKKKDKAGGGFYEEEPSPQKNSTGSESLVIDPDLDLFFKACTQLLTSRSSAVVVAVARSFLYLGTKEHMDLVIGPLVALLRSPSDMQQPVLYDLVATCMLQPASFVPYVRHFLIGMSDTPETWKIKLEILTLTFPLCDEFTKGMILNELEHFTKSNNESLVRESVRAIGRCANDPGASNRCMHILLGQTSSIDGALVAEALNVVRKLIQQDPASHMSTVIKLARNLDTMTDPDARANVIWLVGEFAGVGGSDNIAPDVLRILLQNFSEEAEPTRLQIVLLAARVLVHHRNQSDDVEEPESKTGTTSAKDPTSDPKPAPKEEGPILALWEYVQLLCRYDSSYDLRDRARLFKSLLADPSTIQLANLLLLAPKPVPYIPSPSEARKDVLLGSATLVIGDEAGSLGLKGFESLPEWVEAGHEPDPQLREELVSPSGRNDSKAVPASSRLDAVQREKSAERPSSSVGKNKDKTLDDWLAEEEGKEVEIEDEEESSEESGETETESESSSSDSD